MNEESEFRFEKIDEKHVKVTTNRGGKLFEIVLLLLSEKAAKSIEAEPAKSRVQTHAA